jgi:hypothetical protein
VYLAGYGVQLDNENYFVPVDAKIASASDVAAEAPRLSDYTMRLAGLSLKDTLSRYASERRMKMNPLKRRDVESVVKTRGVSSLSSRMPQLCLEQKKRSLRCLGLGLCDQSRGRAIRFQPAEQIRINLGLIEVVRKDF